MQLSWSRFSIETLDAALSKSYCLTMSPRNSLTLVQSKEYAAALSAILLKKCCKSRNLTEPHASHRAAAYVLAERVLLKHFGSQPQL